MNNCEDAKSIKDALAQNGIYSGLTSGISMEPLIHHQKDTVIVVAPKGRMKKYDIPRLYSAERQIRYAQGY